jgi:hypothetical protein
LLISEGADPEQVTAQFLECDPAGDPDAVRALQAAAAAALQRGAPETAVVYLRRALAEPPPEPVRPVVLSELGGAERIARDSAAVMDLERAWQTTTDPVARARLADQLADALFHTGDVDRCAAVLQVRLDDLASATRTWQYVCLLTRRS